MVRLRVLFILLLLVLKKDGKLAKVLSSGLLLLQGNLRLLGVVLFV